MFLLLRRRRGDGELRVFGLRDELTGEALVKLDLLSEQRVDAFLDGDSGDLEFVILYHADFFA